MDSLRFLYQRNGDGTSWSLQGPTPLGSGPAPLPRIAAASPVALLPAHEPPLLCPSATSTDCHVDGAAASAMGAKLAVRAWVAVPHGTCCLRGWAEGLTETGPSEAPARQGSCGDGNDKGGSRSAGYAGSLSVGWAGGAGAGANMLCAPLLCVLARAGGMYLPTHVQQAEAGLHESGGGSSSHKQSSWMGIPKFASPGLSTQLVEVGGSHEGDRCMERRCWT